MHTFDEREEYLFRREGRATDRVGDTRWREFRAESPGHHVPHAARRSVGPHQSAHPILEPAAVLKAPATTERFDLHDARPDQPGARRLSPGELPNPELSATDHVQGFA